MREQLAELIESEAALMHKMVTISAYLPISPHVSPRRASCTRW